MLAQKHDGERAREPAANVSAMMRTACGEWTAVVEGRPQTAVVERCTGGFLHVHRRRRIDVCTDHESGAVVRAWSVEGRYEAPESLQRTRGQRIV